MKSEGLNQFSITIEEARKAMWKTLLGDPELAETYVAMIEGVLIDMVSEMRKDRKLSAQVAKSIYIALYREEDSSCDEDNNG